MLRTYQRSVDGGAPAPGLRAIALPRETPAVDDISALARGMLWGAAVALLFWVPVFLGYWAAFVR